MSKLFRRPLFPPPSVPRKRKWDTPNKKVPLMGRWYKAGGTKTASPEMKAIVQVFEDAKASADIGSKFLNSKSSLSTS